MRFSQAYRSLPPVAFCVAMFASPFLLGNVAEGQVERKIIELDWIPWKVRPSAVVHTDCRHAAVMANHELWIVDLATKEILHRPWRLDPEDFTGGSERLPAIVCQVHGSLEHDDLVISCVLGRQWRIFYLDERVWRQGEDSVTARWSGTRQSSADMVLAQTGTPSTLIMIPILRQDQGVGVLEPGSKSVVWHECPERLARVWTSESELLACGFPKRGPRGQSPGNRQVYRFDPKTGDFERTHVWDSISPYSKISRTQAFRGTVVLPVQPKMQRFSQFAVIHGRQSARMRVPTPFRFLRTPTWSSNGRWLAVELDSVGSDYEDPIKYLGLIDTAGGMHTQFTQVMPAHLPSIRQLKEKRRIVDHRAVHEAISAVSDDGRFVIASCLPENQSETATDHPHQIVIYDFGGSVSPGQP